jgi:hypothetical protein
LEFCSSSKENESNNLFSNAQLFIFIGIFFWNSYQSRGKTDQINGLFALKKECLPFHPTNKTSQFDGEYCQILPS